MCLVRCLVTRHEEDEGKLDLNVESRDDGAMKPPPPCPPDVVWACRFDRVVNEEDGWQKYVVMRRIWCADCRSRELNAQKIGYDWLCVCPSFGLDGSAKTPRLHQVAAPSFCTDTAERKKILRTGWVTLLRTVCTSISFISLEVVLLILPREDLILLQTSSDIKKLSHLALPCTVIK